MADDNVNEQIEGLKDLRAYVIATRRTGVRAIGHTDDRIELIIQCQDAIKAIDEAIADERAAQALTRQLKTYR